MQDFETRDGLCALLTGIEPAAPDDLSSLVPSPRTSPESSAPLTSTVEYGPLMRLRLGPGVPDEALLNPRPVDALFAKRRRGIGRVLAWLGLSLLIVGAGAGAAWWFLLR